MIASGVEGREPKKGGSLKTSEGFKGGGGGHLNLKFAWTMKTRGEGRDAKVIKSY